MQDQKNSPSTILAEAMKNSGISLEKLSAETGVSEMVITQILEEDFKNFPPTPYLHGYIVKVFEYFNIDGEKIWQTYFKGSELLRQSGKNDRLPENRFSVSRINNKLILIILVIIAIPAYFIVSSVVSQDLSRHLSLENLNNDVVVTATSTFSIKGNIAGNSGLIINDVRVSPNSDGDFQTSVELSPGFNTITFIIEGSLGKRETVTRQVFYETEEIEEEFQEEAPTTTQEEFISEEEFDPEEEVIPNF